MYHHIIEKNERRNQQSAFWLAITLHVVLGAFVYFQAAAARPAPKTEVVQTVTKAAPVKSRPAMRP